MGVPSMQDVRRARRSGHVDRMLDRCLQPDGVTDARLFDCDCVAVTVTVTVAVSVTVTVTVTVTVWL